VEDDPERVPKRSRDKGHREERGRRSTEKDHERPRESDRRRRDRDTSDVDGRSAPLDKPSEKRIPEGPASSLPPSTPSAPRAMASGEPPRSSKSEAPTGRERLLREPAPHQPQNGPSVSSQPPAQEPGSGSLRSRIGERELPLPRTPQAPSSHRSDPAALPERNRADEDRDGARKRTMSDREKDAAGDATLSAGPDAVQPPKRPRIIRNRYTSGPSHAIAKKLLPIDPQAADKTRAGRKD